jgi:glycosyltransferase involved in cell wall biosynthesis
VSLEPLVTVAVVTYNEQEALPRLLRSFSKVITSDQQDFFRWLFIDNHSSDRSCEIIEDWLSRHPGFTGQILKRKTNHMAEARNLALRRTTSPWLAFIDADTYLQPGWGGSVLKRLGEIHGTVVAIGGVSRYRQDHSWHSGALMLSSFFPIGKKEDQWVEVGHVPTNNMLVRRQAALAAGLFDTFYQRVGEDLDFNIRLKSQGQIFYDPSFSVVHTLPSSESLWYRKMLLYGTAQSTVFLRNGRGVPWQKFLPGIFIMILLFVLLAKPFILLVTLLLGSLVPLLRVNLISCLSYGLGEWLGLLKYLKLQGFGGFHQELPVDSKDRLGPH